MTGTNFRRCASLKMSRALPCQTQAQCVKGVLADFLLPDLSFDVLSSLLTNMSLVAALILSAVGQFQGSLSLDDQLDMSYRMCLMQDPEYRVWINSFLLKTGFNMMVDADPVLRGPLNISDALLSTQGSLFGATNFAVVTSLSSDLQRIDRVFHHTRSTMIPPGMKSCDLGIWSTMDKFSIAVTLCLAVTVSSAVANGGLRIIQATYSDPGPRRRASLEGWAEPVEIQGLTKLEKFYSRCIVLPVIIVLYALLCTGMGFFGWSFADFGVGRQPQIAAVMTNNLLFYILFIGVALWASNFAYTFPFAILQLKKCMGLWEAEDHSTRSRRAKRTGAARGQKRWRIRRKTLSL